MLAICRRAPVARSMEIRATVAVVMMLSGASGWPLAFRANQAAVTATSQVSTWVPALSSISGGHIRITNVANGHEANATTASRTKRMDRLVVLPVVKARMAKM